MVFYEESALTQILIYQCKWTPTKLYNLRNKANYLCGHNLLSPSFVTCNKGKV